MAYQFADGFDNYGNNFTLTAGYPWDQITGGTATVINTDFRFAAPGSLPGGCLSLPASCWVRKNLSGSQATLVVGFGVKVSVLPNAAADLFFLADNGTIQVSLAVNSNGALQFYRGGVNGGTAIGTPSANNTLIAGTWYGLAAQVTINSTTGSGEVFLNGAASPVLNVTGLNNQASANASASQVAIGTTVNSGGMAPKFDDFYCFDTTGVFLNSLLAGDARILTKMPSGAGNYTNWTPNGLGANWQNAAVLPPNTTDFNANNVGTTKDSYATQAASLAVAPYFVLARASMERDDAGTHTPSIFVRSSTTDSSGVVTPALTSSYVFYDAIFQNDPATSASWTGPGADNAQVGVIEG